MLKYCGYNVYIISSVMSLKCYLLSIVGFIRPDQAFSFPSLSGTCCLEQHQSDSAGLGWTRRLHDALRSGGAGRFGIE